MQSHSLGDIFKIIREEVLNMSLADIGRLLSMSSSSYNRLEKNDFGKGFSRKINVELKYYADLISLNVIKINKNSKSLVEKLKITLISTYKNSNFFDSSTLNLLESSDISNDSSLSDFIFSIFLIFSGESNIKLSFQDVLNEHIHMQHSIRIKNSLDGFIFNYKEMKNCIIKLVSMIRPTSILEIECGSGSASLHLSKAFPECKITAVSSNSKMLKRAQDALTTVYPNTTENIERNLCFKEGTFNYFENLSEMPDFILMSYSFHHIKDPLENKINYLKQLKNRMKPNTVLCIADNYLPATDGIASEKVINRSAWNQRIQETYYNSFWESLRGISTDSVSISRDFARNALDCEIFAANEIESRNTEFLVTMPWLTKVAQDIGFTVNLSEFCNGCNDGIIVLTA